MKIKFKRITALFAALAIMITALPLTIIPISAAGTDGESTEYSSDGYLIVRNYQQLRLAYNGSEESKIRLGADIDCDPEEYKPNYLTRLCPPIESDKTLDLAGYTLKKTGNKIDAQDHLLSVQYSKLTIEDSVGTGKMYFYAKDVAQNLFLAENRSTIVINGGTFCYTGTNAMYCEMIKLSASDLVINDGYFDAQIGTPIKLDNGFAGGQGTLNSTALINGGTIVTTSSIEISSIDGCAYYASLVMTGGTITNKSKGRVTDKTGTIISDPYFVRVKGDEALQNKYYNITLLGGTMPLSPNDINVYYPADKAVLTSKAGTITNSAEKVEYTTLLTAPQAGIDEKKAMAARGADEICRLKTDRNNYVLSHTKRTRFTVNSNSVGKIDLLTQAPNPYGTGDPIKSVDWYVSKNFGSFTAIPEAVNDLSYTPPEVTEKCTMLYKAVINYGNVLRINEIIIIDYDFEAVTEIKAVVSGFHGGSTLSDVSVASSDPKKYSLTINNIRDVYGNNIVNDRQLCKGFKYNIFINVKLNSGYVAAYTTDTAKIRRFEDPANEWQTAGHIYAGLNEIAFLSVLVCDEGIKTVGVEISNFLPYRKVNDLQLTSSEPDKYSVTLVTPLLNLMEYNEEVYDDDELIVDDCYTVEFKVTPKSGYALSPGYIFRCRLDTYREDFWLTSEDEELFTVSNNGTVVINSLRVPFEEYDQNIYTQITPPKAGGTPATKFTSHNLPEHMSLIDIEWYDEEDWETATVFENGKAYWCYIYINTDCYEYNLKKAKFYLNGRQINQGCGYDKKKRYYYLVGSKRFVVVDKLEKPTGFEATSVTSSEISLKWDKNAIADGYVLEKNEGTKWVTIKSISGNSNTSYKVSGLAAGEMYSFRLKSYIEDKSSDFVTLNVNTKLNATTGMKCAAKTSSDIKLQWDKNTSAGGYVLDVYDGTKWKSVKTFTSNADTSFDVAGLQAGTTYKFRLRAYKTFGSVTEYSDAVYLDAATNPNAPTGMKCSAKTSSDIKLQWDKNTSAGGYVLDVYDSTKWKSVKTFTSNADTSFDVVGLQAGTTYKFRLRAYKTLGSVTEYSDAVYLNATTNPNAPTGMKCAAKTSSDIKLQWDKNTSADGYVLDVYDSTKWKSVKTFTSNADISFDVVGLQAGTTYKFRLRAYKTFGSVTEYSDAVYLDATTNPNAPTGMKCSSKTDVSANLQWDKNTSASGYELQKWDGKKWVTLTKISKNSTTTYTVKSLKASTTYKYRIRAYKTIGKTTQYSAYTATLSVNTNPSNMSGFKAKSKSYNSITLQWNKNASATGYELQKWDGKKWVSLTKISKNSTTTYTVKSLKASTNYKYRIRAYKTISKATQYSAYSAMLSVNTNPSNMSGFKAKAKSYNSITLQWNKNTSATGYELQKWDGKKWVTLTKISKNSTTTYTIRGLKASTTYKYRIRAYKTIGKATQYSAYSATLSVNTNPYNMSGFKAKSKSYNSITLQWNKNTSATGYELQKWDGKKWVTLTKIAKNSTTTYTVKGLKASTTYKYRIRAYKTIGKATQYSAYTTTLSVNTNPYNMSGFKAKSTAKTSVTLQWNKNTSATGYEIQKWNGKKWVSAAKVTKNSTVTSTVKSLKANTSYKFRIRAYKTIGKATQYSSWSGTLTVKTKK